MDEEGAIGRQRRTEDFGIEFNSYGEAIGWSFDVLEAFRDAIDIKYLSYVDKEKTEELRKKLGRAKDALGRPITVTRMAWTRGVPPLRSFARGDVFYDPPGARRKDMAWGEALRTMRRRVQVKEATPDSGNGAQGSVRFELVHYADGRAVKSEEWTCSQAEFEEFLRSGELRDNEEKNI